jgi:hypothetical protein
LRSTAFQQRKELSINNAAKNGYNLQKNKAVPSNTKKKSKSIIDLDVKTKTIKILDKNTKVHLRDLKYDTKITNDA